MCGILCIFNTSVQTRKQALILRKKIQHRGMDESGIVTYGSNSVHHFMCHERLAIVDPESGSQPLVSVCEYGEVCVCVNGEIYNHLQLRNLLKFPHTFKTNSDCEIIIHLYEEHGEKFVDYLVGDFSFVLYDKTKNIIIAARDHLGIVPLYQGYGRDGSIWFASEMKAIPQTETVYNIFEPGTMYVHSGGIRVTTRWYNPSWTTDNFLKSFEYTPLKVIRDSFTDAVARRLMADVPFGVCLSGGLDSSLVASVCRRLLGKDAPLHSFCIGLEGSPDLKAAKMVADHLNTTHHEFTFTLEDGIDALRDVIYHTETYDVTTIRASTPMYLLARHIRSLGFKMVLSGEGADEVFGGYLYFHKAPSPLDFFHETVRKVKALHQYDCLRANKSMMAWGVEVRVPFLDKLFLDTAMNINPELKMIKAPTQIMEKYILRKAFSSGNYLPDNILWRQKEQFSDGVGYNWIDGLKEYASAEISDTQLSNAKYIFPINTPVTKEGFLYRSIFHELFPQECAAKTVPGGPSIACSSSVAVEWDKSFTGNLDPSGRSVGVHTSEH